MSMQLSMPNIFHYLSDILISIYLFQPPYNEFMFSVVGDDTSEEFFQVDQRTGEVSVKKDLMLDTETRTTYYVSVF